MKQMALKGKNVVVYVDYREGKSKVVNFLVEKGVDVKVVNLEVGDYICSERVGIERKNINDLISSIEDGRLFEQAEKLRKHYEIPIIVVEGLYHSRDISQNAYMAALASLTIKLKVNILFTKSPFETANLIFWLAKKEQEEHRFGVAFKPRSKKPSDLEKLKVSIVSSLPGVSLVLSKRLLKKFGSVERVFTAREFELEKVQGIGKKLAKKIRKVLTSKYLGD